ncbi:hypothetical protein [Brevibacillus laterosporus]|nr:hypothetical protein [Brevibacillus laterosporus]
MNKPFKDEKACVVMGDMMGKNHRTWFWMNYSIGQKKTVWIGL